MEYKDFLTFKHEKFNFWSNKVLPLVYDDSLSYYEVICKLAQYQEYMRNYFVNLFYLLEEQIASINEKENDFASKNRDVGDLVWINDELYRVIHKIPAGNHYVIGENIEHITVETLIKTGYKSIADYIETDDKTSSRENPAGTLIWYMGGLYECIKDIATGEGYVVNNNIIKTTVEEQLKKIKLEIDRLEQKIDKEIQDRIDGDNNLQNQLNQEIAERKEADTQINTRIDNLVIGGGGGGGTTDLTDVYNQINTEKTNRETADADLQTQITSNDTDIANLNTGLTTLQTSIANEANTRLTKDNDLQSQIDALKNNQGTTGSDIAITEITAAQVDTWYDELLANGTITQSEVATLGGTNTWTGTNDFTSITKGGKELATVDQIGNIDTTNIPTLNANNTFSGTINNFTGLLQKGGKDVATVDQIPDTNSFVQTNSNNVYYGTNDYIQEPTVNGAPLATESYVMQSEYFLKTKANVWSAVNDFKNVTVHGEEYTPTQVIQLTGIDEYNFERIVFVGETIDLTLPTNAIANTYMNPEGIISIDTSGATVNISGVAQGETLLGLQTITGYTIEMTFYCKSARASGGATIGYSNIEGITNGQIIQTGTTLPIYSRLYAKTANDIASLPTNQTPKIYVNNSETGVDGCSIVYNGNMDNQDYTIASNTYTGFSKGIYTITFSKAGIYTLSAFFLGDNNAQNSPTATIDEGLYTNVITVAVTDTGTSKVTDKIDVASKLSYFEQMVSKFIADYYETKTLILRGNSNTASCPNFMLAWGGGNKQTAFTFETNIDLSRITVDETSKEYVTFDFTNKYFTYIKSTVNNDPLGVTIMVDGVSVGTAYICFTTTKACPETNINYTASIHRL